jgi:signal transduction histidine kinase
MKEKNIEAGKIIDERRKELSRLMLKAQDVQPFDLWASRIGQGRESKFWDSTNHFIYLAEALLESDPDLFSDYVKWLEQLFIGFGFPSGALPSMLETERYDELGKLNNELANLQREISKKNVELEKLNEEKNRFLGMAAHDLRNPLHAIQMYSEFLLDETRALLGQEHRSFLEIIHSSSQFMLRLVNDLLDVAKIESGKLVLEIAPTDLVELVNKCGETNNVLASRKNISVTFELCDSIPELLLDASKIEQALNNLISNAVKFSEFGSRVVVKMSSTPEEVTISVIDEGPGIPEHELGKLFQPFQRTSVKSTGGEESTGLGLAIVKKIVLGHNGRVWVESQPGKGSAFFMALPIP